MFKRIAKITGFVLLGFVLLVGGVVGFMAIRGDFKKKVVKPTAIDFSISKTDLTFDASLKNNQTVDNEQIFSFTISAEPLDVTETKCKIEVNYSNLITFVEWKDGQWIDYNSNQFHLNAPIFFKLNDITDENLEDYQDGILTITVIDESGLLRDTLDLAIDRNVTSISFKDRGINENNTITNGLFVYEGGKYYGEVNQTLEAIEGEDYPLEVITAPHKASKPFDSKTEKIHEIYFIEDGQPRLINYNTEDKIVELLRYDDHGNMVAETCNFLKFDTENKYFVFNSQQSGEYEFKLATYPTYAIQEEMLSQDMSFIERLQSREENDTPTMLTKTVIITVNGTEAEEITFEGDEEKITMGLLQDNKWVANDNTVLDMYNLGLTLSKATSQTEILGRYNELKFLSSDNFIDKLTWTFKQAVLNGENYTYGKDDIIVNFYTNASGNIKARISGLTSENIDNTIEYDVRLEKYYSSYNLTLSYTKYQEDEETIESATTITFALIADEVTGRELRLSGIQKESSVITTVTIYKQVAEMEGETSYLSLYLQSGNCLILGDQILENNQPTGMYKFKTLQAGLYLALLGADGDTELYTLINEKFITNIDYDGASSVITIKPIDGDLIGRDIKLYAIVINSNGTWTYTNTEKSAIVNDKIHSTVNLSNNGQLSLPVTIDENGLDYGKGFDVEDLAWVQEGSSYSELLMFAPRYTMLTQKPAEWDKGLVVYKCTDANAQVYIKTNSKDETWGTTQYYTKNNFKTIDCITITEADITYYLLGVIENGHFVNKVIPTGTNYYSKLYPVLIKSKYIHAQNGLQTAESYVDELLSANYADGVAIFNGGDVGIKYDTTLLPERYITKTASAYVITTGIYNANKQYYIYNIEIGMYELVDTMPQNDIDNWASAKLNYYEKVDYLRAIDVLGLVSTEDTSNINVNLTYYTLNTTTNTLDNPIKYVSGDTDFISNWSSYYIIVSHYIINSAESDGEFITDGNNITIKASVVSGGIRVGAPVEFVISVSDYNAAIKENLDVDYAELYMTSVATANSYYDFRASDIEPTVGFGGSYFDNEQTYNGDIYQIIAGHKEIEFGWEQTTKNPIKDQEAQVFFSVNSNYNTEILQNIMTKLSHDDSIRVLEYDEHDNFVGLVSGKVSITAINNGYICANATYNPSLKYYTFENDSYTLATIDENVDWAKDYNKYYINAIYATFEVTDVIAEGHYIRFEWSYVNDYKILSSKLIILSRNVTGYSIDVGSPVYEAKLLTQETYTGDFYTYDKDANVFTIVDKNETPYNSEGGYYQLLTTEYTGDISYVLEISYNAGYVYNVYIVNTSEDYLYYKEGDALKRKMVNATVAFKLSANGGWIKPEPFYAQNVEYDIESNAYIQFDYDENSNTYNIVNAKITDESKNKGFVNITLQPDEGSVNKTINLKIVDDGKFALRLDAITTKTSSMEFKLSENIYTYNNDSIASQLSVDVTGFAIGQKDSDLYETQYNANAIEIVEIATGTPIVSVECIGNIWTITRKNTFDYITLNVEFAGIGEPVTKVFSFESPYTIVKSQDNTTSVIYSGTTFVIAKDSSVKDLDTLYTFTIATKETALTIEYKLEGISKTYEAIEGSDGKWLFVVPTDVTAPTKATFTIKYGTYVADTFELEVRPNMVLGATDDIQLDDLTNSTYEFVNLNISKYKTVDENSAIIEYTTYASNLEKVTTLSDLEYEYVTFTDEACQNQYSINVVSIDEDENKLKVISPISKVGTYYVKVWIYNVDATIGRIQIGEVKFEITTKSQVVNASNPIIIDAKTNKEYSINQLRQGFKLSRNGEISNLDLTDILWITTDNQNIEITYKYDDYELKQVINTINNQQVMTLTYNGATYKLIGTTYNMDGYTYDIYNNQFKDSTGKLLATDHFGNIAYYAQGSESTIYCKQNAYLFENVNNSNDILAISIESAGKTIYKFKAIVTKDDFTLINASSYDKAYYKLNNDLFTIESGSANYDANNCYSLNIESIALGELQSLNLYYNTFGKDLTTNVKYVDTFEYSIELVFNNNNIKTNDIYNIYVQPYKVEPKVDIVLNNSYVLYDSANAHSEALFNVAGLLLEGTKISFGTSTDNSYTITSRGTTQYIKFNIQGNSDIITVPVTLYYEGGLTYTYDVEFTVLNKTAININYPYNVNEVDGENTYKLFNASVDELTKSVDNLYDANDLAQWLGVDTTDVEWRSKLRVQYDIALKSSEDLVKIDLSNDNLLNINRYQAYEFKHIESTDEYADKTYYYYDTITKSFKLLESEPQNWGNTLIYFKKSAESVAINNIEVVAVSSTYANNAQSVVDAIITNGNIISISPSLNHTGYVAFKVYAGDTGAYGYYILKIVDDSQFENVIGFSAPRATHEIEKVIKSSDEIKIIDLIGNRIETDNTGLSYDLVNTDYSNAYLFMVNSEGASSDGEAEFKDGTTIDKGRLIPHNKVLGSSENIQTITLAVVVHSGTSLVHVCNYKLILQVDVEVIHSATISGLDEKYYIYQTALDFNYDSSNTYDLSDETSKIYFKLNGGRSLDTIEFMAGDGYYSSSLTVGEDVKINDTTIASVNGTSLTLYKAVKESIYFYLKLTYDTGFEIYLRITINPFNFTAGTEFIVGKYETRDNVTKFYNDFDLSLVYGKYNGNYKLEYTIGGNTTTIDTSSTTFAGTKGMLTLPTDASEYNVTVTITLLDVLPNMSKTVIVKVLPNITNEYPNYEGSTQTGTRATLDVVAQNTTITPKGSSLDVNINKAEDMATITIKNKNKEYLVVRVGSFKSVNFTLTDDAGNTLVQPDSNSTPYYYFVNSDGTLAQFVSFEEFGTLYFVHSAQDVALRLNVTVTMEDGTNYTTAYPLYITLPKTYTIDTTYRVDGANYETVINGSELNLTDRYYQYDDTDKTYTLVSSIDDVTTLDTTEWYDVRATLLTGASYTGTYYAYNATNNTYTKSTDDYEADKYYTITAIKLDINSNFFGNEYGTNVDVDAIVNPSRIQITIGNNTFNTFDDVRGLGLLTNNNPNKFTYSMDAIEEDNTSSIDSGIITFRSDANDTKNTLTLSNTTTTVSYEFRVRSQDTVYSKVMYNNNLLQGDSDGDKVMDYISISYSQLYNFADKTNRSLELAYLQYLPDLDGADGQVGKVVILKDGKANNNLTYSFVTDVASTTYVSKVLLTNNGLITDTTSGIIELDVIIITINGVSGRIKLVISDFEVTYGYSLAGESSETADAGTQIGKLTDNYSVGNMRANIKFDGVTYDSTAKGADCSIKYFGAINGHVTHWAFGVEPDYDANNSSLVYYNTSGVIASRSVARTTLVTMIFDVIDNDTDWVVGRVYYNITLLNNIKIGLNLDLDSQSAVDLYLGSQIYTTDTSKTYTEINLLQSEDAGYYNNLFVTLEQYSTGNIIYNGDTYVGKALYNGSESDTRKTQSVLTESVVKNYLQFTISNAFGEVDGNVEVTPEGKLKIYGNPTGSFTLNVFSANGTGYGESFNINVHKYDNTLAQFSEQVNRYQGEGYASGDVVQLFKDIGLANSENKDAGNFAFATYREGFIINKDNTLGSTDHSIFANTTISYQVKTFDYTTTIAQIKQDSEWEDTSIKTMYIKWVDKDEDKENVDNVVYATSGGTFEYTLPSVKYSTNSEGKEYQIVSVRLTIEYNGDKDYYYSHYLVYNKAQLQINESYKDKVVTYGSTAWKEGNTITIMGSNGLYVWNDDSDLIKDTDSETGAIVKYKVYLEKDGKLLDEPLDNFKVVSTTEGEKQVVGDLSDGLFTNQEDITFVIKAVDGGAELLRETWTLTADKAITAKDSRPLRDFCLTSDIPDQKYYNIDIIAVINREEFGSEDSDDIIKGFVNNATDYRYTNKGHVAGCGTLYEIVYTGENSGCTVFDIKATYYFIYSDAGNLIKFNFNGGDYYINVTIDDNNLKNADGSLNTTVTIDMADFITYWYYDNTSGKFKQYETYETFMYMEVTEDISNPNSETEVIIKNIDKMLSIPSKEVQVTCYIEGKTCSTSRDIELYFNIIINAKDLDSDGDGKLDGVMPYNDTLYQAMQNTDELTTEDINNNLVLKRELLSLIKFNGQDISTDNTTLTYWTIEVKTVENEDCYSINYTYTNGASTYTRTLKISNVSK